MTSRSEREVERTFEAWINEMFSTLRGLPFGFQYVDHDDPYLLLVTDGEDEYVIEFSVDAIRQERVS